jgi:hypothetical protein
LTEEKWHEICVQLKPHLEAIRKIAKENNLGTLCMSTNTDSTYYYNAFIIDKGKTYDFSNLDGKLYLNNRSIGGEDSEAESD